jgi:hypothetical protein
MCVYKYFNEGYGYGGQDERGGDFGGGQQQQHQNQQQHQHQQQHQQQQQQYPPEIIEVCLSYAYMII